MTTVSPPGSGSGGKSSARSVRRWNFAEPATTSTSCSAGRSSSDDVAAPGSERDDVEQQARREHDRALARDVGLERDAQADLHVGGAQLDAGRRGGELDAGQGLDGAARRGDAGGGLQLGEQLCASTSKASR